MKNSEGYYDPTAGLALRDIERNDKRMNNIRRGDIVYIEKYATTGSEQQAGRPAIIVSNDMNNEYSETVEIVYLTTSPKNNLPTHVTIRSAPRESIALCEQITSVSKMKVGDFICSASAEEMSQVDIALLISLDLVMGRSEAPAAPQKTPESIASPPPTHPDFSVAYRVEQSESEKLQKQIIKLETELAVYKGLYTDMADRAMGGRAASA